MQAGALLCDANPACSPNEAITAACLTVDDPRNARSPKPPHTPHTKDRPHMLVRERRLLILRKFQIS